jgi:SulP family sulfate permease
MGALLFLHRMAEAVEVEDDVADAPGEHYDAKAATDRNVMVYRINGAFFFGATARVLTALERVGAPPRLFVLDFTDVPMIDTTAAHSLVAFVHKLNRAGTEVCFAAARPNVRHELTLSGLKPPLVRYAASVAIARAKS